MEEMGRVHLMLRESCSRARAWGMHAQPQVQLQTGRGTFLTRHLNITGLSPSAFQRPRACGISSLRVPWKAVLSSPIGEWGAGVCWSEQGAVAVATSIGPARRPEELLWVLRSLRG